MTKRVLWYPILLVCLILLVDKLALIEGVRKYGRADPTPLENILTFVRQKLSPRLRDDRREKPIVFFLGTSRSDIFRHLHPATIRETPFLTSEEKDLLLGMEFETRAILKASELFLQFALLEALLRDGARPDLVVLEVSPEMFNGGSPFHMRRYLRGDIFDYTLLWKSLDFLEGDLRKEAWTRFFSATYAFRFRPERALGNFLRGKEAGDGGYAVSLLDLYAALQPLPENLQDYEAENIPEKIFAERFRGYADYLERENVLMNYRHDPAEMGALLSILDMALAAKIPLVVWIPYVHPELERRWRKSPVYPEVDGEIRNRGFPIFFGPKTRFECRYFTDSSHLSGRCTPYLMRQILKTAGEAYPVLEKGLTHFD